MLHPNRDLRIDFFRGVALLVIFMDHFELLSQIHLIRKYTLVSVSFCDAAEVFVFLSGYVFGLVYEGVRQTCGFSVCLRKSYRRCAQVYGAYVLTVWAILALRSLASFWHCYGGLRHAIPATLKNAFCWGPSLLYQPCGLEILAFYPLVLAFMPFLLQLLKKAPCLAWAISGGAYLATQLVPSFNLPTHPQSSHWFFNPFAWQFLFFLGLVIGVHRYYTNRPLPRNRLFFALCIFGVGVAFISKKVLPELVDSGVLASSFLSQFSASHLPLLLKTSLGPFRLIHFLMLAFVVTSICPRNAAFCRSSIAKPFILCGQHSLPVYCLSVILIHFLAWPFSGLEPTITWILLFHFDGCLILISCAFALHRFRVSRIDVPQHECVVKWTPIPVPPDKLESCDKDSCPRR